MIFSSINSKEIFNSQETLDLNSINEAVNQVGFEIIGSQNEKND